MAMNYDLLTMNQIKTFLPILLFCCFCLTCCTSNQKPDNSSKTYFDLKAYFENKAQYLQKKNPLVKKTIAKNDLTESKNITIRNWANELGLFSGSDINKPAWKTEYEIKNTGNEIQYLAKDNKLKTKKIIIDKSENGKIKHIFILNGVTNNLYTSTEELHYYPDSLYSIRKKQKILIIGSNDYFIVGRIVSAR